MGQALNFPCCDEIGATKWEEEPFAAAVDNIQSEWSNHLFQILNFEQTQYWYALLPNAADGVTPLPVKTMLNMIMSTASARVEVYCTKCFDYLEDGMICSWLGMMYGPRCLSLLHAAEFDTLILYVLLIKFHVTGI